LEQERNATKIKNPHKFDSKTSNDNAYKGTSQKPIVLERRKHDDEKKPIIGFSSYQKAFPNWQNGSGDVFYEKQP